MKASVARSGLNIGSAMRLEAEFDSDSSTKRPGQTSGLGLMLSELCGMHLHRAAAHSGAICHADAHA